MPRPREAKPTAHPVASPQKSHHSRVTTLVNIHGVLTALGIRRDVSDYLDSNSHTANSIRLNQGKEGEIMSDCLAEGFKP